MSDDQPDLTNYPDLNEFLNEKKGYYMLDKDRNIIPASLLEWGTYLENTRKERIVKKDHVNGYRVSTVFLGLDHNYDPSDNKLHIFETMVFKERTLEDIYCDRYATWEEAEIGHARAMQWVKDGCKDE
jgi:hypothetical protein